MNCPLLQRSPWYCTLFLTAFLSGHFENHRCMTWRHTGSDQWTNVYPRDGPSLLRFWNGRVIDWRLWRQCWSFRAQKRSAQASAHPLSPAFVCLVLWEFWHPRRPRGRQWGRGNLRSGSIFVSLWKLHSGRQGETKRITSVACFSSMQIFQAWEKCRPADLKNTVFIRLTALGAY